LTRNTGLMEAPAMKRRIQTVALAVAAFIVVRPAQAQRYNRLKLRRSRRASGPEGVPLRRE